jgi:hypothetical protein
MGTQSGPPDGNPPDGSRGGGNRFGQRENERAFVILFDPIEGARSRLRGRVEIVASGETTRFRSLKQLVGFMVGALRRRPTAEP